MVAWLQVQGRKSEDSRYHSECSATPGLGALSQKVELHDWAVLGKSVRYDSINSVFALASDQILPAPTSSIDRNSMGPHFLEASSERGAQAPAFKANWQE